MSDEPDHYVDPDGRWVFTASFLRRRGRCCGSGCRHCPYVPRHGGEEARLPEGGAGAPDGEADGHDP